VALAAQTEMQQVQKLIEQGDWQGAQAKLEAVTTTVAGVGNDERKAELVSQWQELTVKVEAQDPAATVSPGAPLPTFPSISVDPNTLSLTVPTETTSTSSSTDPSATSTPQPTPQPSPTPLPTSTLAPATTVPSPVQQVVPTTTTLLVIPAEPAAPVIPATPPGQVR